MRFRSNGVEIFFLSRGSQEVWDETSVRYVRRADRVGYLTDDGQRYSVY